MLNIFQLQKNKLVKFKEWSVAKSEQTHANLTNCENIYGDKLPADAALTILDKQHTVPQPIS